MVLWGVVLVRRKFAEGRQMGVWCVVMVVASFVEERRMGLCCARLRPTVESFLLYLYIRIIEYVFICI